METGPWFTDNTKSFNLLCLCWWWGGQESKRKTETHQLYFFLFYTFLFLNVSLVLKPTPVFSLCCMIEEQLYPSPKAGPFPDPCFYVSVVSQVACTVLEHLLNQLIMLAKMNQGWKVKKKNLAAQNNRSVTAQTSHFPDQWARYFVNQVLGMVSIRSVAGLLSEIIFFPVASYCKIAVKNIK